MSEPTDVMIKLDPQVAVVLEDWLSREARIDGLQWAAGLMRERVALRRLHEALREALPEGIDADQARARLDDEAPPPPGPRIPEDVLRQMPQRIGDRIGEPMPVDNLVMRVANRLDMIGINAAAGSRIEQGQHVMQVGFVPDSEEMAERVRLMCYPVEVRFLPGEDFDGWAWPDE